MPLNLLKVYNQLLDLDYLKEKDRIISLKKIFDRDIKNNISFKFKSKQINPISVEADSMEILFEHLTTVMVDKKSRKRIYESKRSKRLHWIKYHIDENKLNHMLVFSVEDPGGIRTYIYDEDEKYVIILAPYRNEAEYYLLSAHHLTGRNENKIRNKYKRKLQQLF